MWWPKLYIPSTMNTVWTDTIDCRCLAHFIVLIKEKFDNYLTFYVNQLFRQYPTKYRNSNSLFILPIKIWKKNPQKYDTWAWLKKFSVLPKWLNLPNNSKSTPFIRVFIVHTVKSRVVDRSTMYSILELFGQRSQYIIIKFPLHKPSENLKMCY